MTRPVSVGDGFRFGLGLILAAAFLGAIAYLCILLIKLPAASEFGDWLIPRKSNVEQER